MNARLLVVALALLMLVSLSGCAGPSKAVLAEADYGPPPEFYEQRIKSYMNIGDADYHPGYGPEWRFAEPTRVALRQAGQEQWGYGWVVVTHVNLKLHYGGYRHQAKFLFAFVGDSMHEVTRKDRIKYVD